MARYGAWQGYRAVEAMACFMSIVDQVVPPTINHQNPDPACDLDVVPNQAREQIISTALSNSFGFGGHNISIVLSAPGSTAEQQR